MSLRLPFPGKPRPWGPSHRDPSSRQPMPPLLTSVPPVQMFHTPRPPVQTSRPVFQAPVTVPPIVAIDCEMVRVGAHSELAEVAVVDYEGRPLVHEFVRPSGPVTNYATRFSGITPEKLVGAKSFTHVRNKVLDVLEGKAVTGHALENDFRALRIPQSDYVIYDSAYSTQLMKPGPRGLQPDNLKHLALKYLGRDIQAEEHSGIEDAQVSMELYRRFSHMFDCREKATAPNEKPTHGGTRKNKRTKRRTCRRSVSRRW